MVNKKGQVTIFIIIAIIIVAVFAAYFVFRGGLWRAESLPANLEPVYNGFLSCIEEDALVEALIKSGGVPGPMLHHLHRVIEHAVESGLSTISRSVIDEVYSEPERVEAREVTEEELLPPAQVDLTERDS